MSSPSRQVSGRRVPPLPGNSTLTGQGSPSKISNQSEFLQDISQELNAASVKRYLACSPATLEEYVLQSVSLETLLDWIRKKKAEVNLTSEGSQSVANLISIKAPGLQDLFLDSDIAHVQGELVAEIFHQPDPGQLYYDLSNVLATACKADGFYTYTVKGNGQELQLFSPNKEGAGQVRISGRIGLGTTTSAAVAATKKTLLLRDVIEDDRFPQGTGVPGCCARSALTIPITLPTGDLLSLVELTRSWDSMPFTDAEFHTATALVSWAGAALYKNQLNKTLLKQRELNEFLLEVSKDLFNDIITMDAIIHKIMEYAKSLVNADRCALFLVDEEKGELYSDLFDEGIQEDGKPVFTKKTEIRFPTSRGIAGHVAETGEVVNIPDAYADQRFNREIDRRTGYTTNHILCMPIIAKGNVIGVVQMINKKTGSPFTSADENSFKMFAVYCSLALHYSKVYLELAKQKNMYEVTLEMLQYHRVCSEQELQMLRKRPLPSSIPENFQSMEFYCGDYEPQLPQYFIHMMHDMFGPSCFEIDKLCKFVLTVRKNYRPVAYHNWVHGFNVTHAMYWMLINIRHRGIFTDLEEKALLIACICHDIDHRGYNNAYFTKLNLGLANLYSTSVMEQHHYKTAVAILQVLNSKEEGHDTFGHMSPEEYKVCLRLVHDAIIATDLALYFQNQKSLAKQIESSPIDFSNQKFKMDVVGLMMTMCDLSAVCKLWPTQYNIVQFIYNEFYEQGDKEKQVGLVPIPMMDRDNHPNMPKDQIGFFKFVCVPGYQTLADIFPELKPMLEACLSNLVQWQRIVDGKSTDMWQPDKSIASSEN